MNDIRGVERPCWKLGFDRGVEWDSNSCNPDASWYDSDTILPHAFSTLPITSTELRNPPPQPYQHNRHCLSLRSTLVGTPVAYAPVTVLASRFGVFRFHWLATDRLSSYSYLRPNYASLFLTLSDLHRTSDTSAISPMKRPWKKQMSHTTSSVLFLPVWDLALGCTLRCAHINPRAPMLMGTSYLFWGGCLVSLRTAGA